MKRIAWIVLTLCLMVSCGCAAASGSYTSGDNLGNAGVGSAIVITKSATIRSEPSLQGKKVVSVDGESSVLVLGRFENNWAEVQYAKNGKKYTGWINQNYIVSNYLTLTLRKSNVPAYCAPSRETKIVGSLPKYTQLIVIGMWDDFYIVSLRNASAFIHKDAGLWTSTEIVDLLSEINRRGTTILMVTHDAFTASYCHRILFLQDGAIFSQLERGSRSRRDFFREIIGVVTALGGDQSDVL